jgi:hypothetical protein
MISESLLSTMTSMAGTFLLLLLVAIVVVDTVREQRFVFIYIGFDGIILAGLFATAGYIPLAIAAGILALAAFITAIFVGGVPDSVDTTTGECQ